MKGKTKKILAIIGVSAAVVCAAAFAVIKLRRRVKQHADMKAMRKSQQGELDAVAMYDKLA